MRLSGHRAAIQYISRYLDDYEEDVDPDIAVWIGDGYLEWDPTTESIYMTDVGKLHLMGLTYNFTVH